MTLWPNQSHPTGTFYRRAEARAEVLNPTGSLLLTLPPPHPRALLVQGLHLSSATTALASPLPSMLP